MQLRKEKGEMLKNRKHSWIWRHEKIWRESKESENKERANGLNAFYDKAQKKKMENASTK